MRSITFRGLLALICLVGLTGCEQLMQGLSEKSVVDRAKARVQLALVGATNNSDPKDQQTGIIQWTNPAQGKNHFEQAYDDFHKWLREKGLFRKVTSFEILDAEVEEEGSSTVIVTVKINERTLKIKVPKEAQMSWAKG